MLIYEKGKVLGKLNIVDLVIVLIILAVGIGAYVKFGSDLWKSKAENVIISLYQEEVPDYVANSIKKGDVVIEDTQKAEFGKVENIQIDKSISWAQTDKGEFVKSSKEGYSSISIDVDGAGEITGQGLQIGVSPFYIGKNYTVRIANTMISVRISDIKLRKAK